MSARTILLKGLTAVMLVGIAFSAQATPATSYYVYDEAGHVIGEYDQNGTPVQEHVYLGDRPVAVVQNNTTLDYVTTDQLNTPRAIMDSSGTVQWSWASDPFGNGQPTSNSLTYNLRFPGQYYDAETGYSYNGERDYDSILGRYVESDPSGPAAGLNTYDYVRDNPLSLVDMDGLDAAAPFYANPPAEPLPLPWWEAVPSASASAAASGFLALIYSPSVCQNEDACIKEWEEAYRICRKLILEQLEQQAGRKKSRSVTGVTGGYTNLEDCARGLVSERCGGNKVQH